MAIKIGHATKNEKGKAYGGAAGDQTGKEVCIISWYKGGWHTVLRPKSKALAEKSAVACEAACANENLGYDMAVSQRNTLQAEAVKHDHDLSKIDKPCEADCATFMQVCAIAGGAKLTYEGNGMTTRNMVERLLETGDYEALTEQKYLDSDAYLLRGDILVKSGHTVMALEDGAEARPKEVTIRLPCLKMGDQGEAVEAVQRILSTYGYHLGNNNPFDGKFQKLTDAAVREFQADHGLTVDGEIGDETWTALLGGVAV